MSIFNKKNPSQKPQNPETVIIKKAFVFSIISLVLAGVALICGIGFLAITIKSRLLFIMAMGLLILGIIFAWSARDAIKNFENQIKNADEKTKTTKTLSLIGILVNIILFFALVIIVMILKRKSVAAAYTSAGGLMGIIITSAFFVKQAIIQGTPLLYGSTGEIITEKSGNLNLGIPGIMYMGGISGIIGGYFYEKSVAHPNPILCVVIAFTASLLGSMFLSLIYSFLTITLRANQNVTGLALTTFGVGIGNFFGGSLTKIFGKGGNISLMATGNAFKASLPFAKKLGLFGETFLSFGFMVYLAIIIALFSSYFLTKTRKGLNLRAVGEDPATADAAGINVTRNKYFATIIGGAIAGLGGLYFIMDYTGGSWTNGGFGDRGWLAIALVIFALWKPKSSILGSILFGGLYIIYLYIPGLGRSTQELFKMLPYLVTIVVLVFTSMKKKQEQQPPKSLGLSYFREDR